jgi:class 3 adenylate cyclase
MAALFAATYPERTRALALFNPIAYGSGETVPPLSVIREEWGTREFSDRLLSLGAPALFESEADRRWFSNWLRVSASPAVAYRLNRAHAETDLRDVLPAVRVPTLVLHLPTNQEAAFDVAARIPSAQTVRIAGSGSFGIFLYPEIADELERFVAGEAPPQVPASVLATLMFTDIVGSARRAAELGDAAWRDLLARHNAAVRRELARFGGEERDTAGDGFFATFDGPARAVRAAQAIHEAVRPLELELRIGIHVGECERHENKLAGIALSAGARIAASAEPGEILVSATVRDLVAGSGLSFERRGAHELKGLSGRWDLYAALPERQ